MLASDRLIGIVDPLLKGRHFSRIKRPIVVAGHVKNKITGCRSLKHYRDMIIAVHYALGLGSIGRRHGHDSGAAAFHGYVDKIELAGCGIQVDANTR